MGAWIEITNMYKYGSALRQVAPYMGAWIEMTYTAVTISPADVAPYMGAWIEINMRVSFYYFKGVAPYMGAWIEIVPYTPNRIHR